MCEISYIRRPSTPRPFFRRGCFFICALYCKRTSRSPSTRWPRRCLIAPGRAPRCILYDCIHSAEGHKRLSIPQNNYFAEFTTLKFVRESHCNNAIHELITQLAYCISLMHRYALIMQCSYRILMHTFALLYIAKRKVLQKKRILIHIYNG